MSYVMKPHEREQIADIIEWSLQCGITTLELRVYIVHKNVGTGKPHKRIPEFKCTYMDLVNNAYKTKRYVAKSVEDLRTQMGEDMHNKWNKLAMDEGDQIAGEECDDDDLDAL